MEKGAGKTPAAGMRDLGRLLEFVTGGALAGAIAALVRAEPSLERSAAFWVLLLVFVVVLGHLSAPGWTPAVRWTRVAFQRQAQFRRSRRAFSEWVVPWFRLEALLRDAVGALAAQPHGAPEENDWKSYEQEYHELRRYFQQHRWPFMGALTQRLHHRLSKVPRPRGSGEVTYLERELWAQSSPFRLFYALPDLEDEVRGLVPDAIGYYSYNPERHVREFGYVLDRIEDIIREFGVELSVDVGKTAGR